MDRQKECTKETLTRIRRDLGFEQGFYEEAVDYWDKWTEGQRGTYVTFYVMVRNLMLNTGLSYEEAEAKVTHYMKYVE